MVIHDQTCVGWLCVPCGLQFIACVDDTNVQKRESSVLLSLYREGQVLMKFVDLLKFRRDLVAGN